MREFEWTLDGEVVASGSVSDDGSATVMVVGMEPIHLFSVEEMEERFRAMPRPPELRWTG